MMDCSDGSHPKMIRGTIIPADFYKSDDVVAIAQQLLGKVLVFQTERSKVAGCIIETEAYAGITDKASHAYGGLLTKRTEVMFREGGIAYVYLCYGLHALFNVVSSARNTPHAVLIRGIIPLEGLDIMESNLGRKVNIVKDGIGPGRLTRLLGISKALNGVRLDGAAGLHISDYGIQIDAEAIISCPRIGVAYAGEDALLDYRFKVDVDYAIGQIKKGSPELRPASL